MPNRKALEYLAAQPWAITPEVWEVGRRIVLREADPAPVAVEQRPGRKMDGAEGVTVRDGVATIRVVGPRLSAARGSIVRGPVRRTSTPFLPRRNTFERATREWLMSRDITFRPFS